MKYVSVFIPTYNGVDIIGETIKSVLSQKLPRSHGLDFLIIDSGSTDGTVDIIQQHADQLRFEQIPNSEFGHGRTRSKAAHMAKGDYVLFLSQDATPAGDRWLINMIEPFLISDKVGGVFGRQIPRPNAPPTIKREVIQVFNGFGPHDSILIQRHKSLVDNTETNPLNSFFSDVNSAVRRDLLIGDIPFRDVKYAEDQMLAEDMQAKGYLKAFSPLGAVWHSNEYTAKQYFHRKFDEYIGLHETVNYKLVASRKSILLGWIRPTLTDWRFIKRDTEYSTRSKFVWFLEAPLYNIAVKAGQYYAAKSLRNPKLKDKFSLEGKNRA